MANETHTTRESILVVDDDKAFRVATKILLEDEGYRVQLASSGDEALGTLSSSDIDLVLSDLVMTKMTGLELLERWPRPPYFLPFA